MRVQLFHDLDAVADDAGGALDRAHRAAPFERLDWFRDTLAHCPPPGRPLVLRAGDTWLFLMRHGRALHALASWYSLRFGPVGEPTPAALQAIAARLRREAATLALAPLADPEPLAAALRAAGWRTHVAPITVNRHVDVVDWPGYWAARPARLRETVRRKGRGDPFRIVVHDRFVSEAWEAYDSVYARSWKPAEGSPAFLRALAMREGGAGALRLGLAYDGDRPVAAQLWLVEQGHATIHKLAHDETDKVRSPGTLLSHAMFRHVIAIDGARSLDFGTGDDAYKVDWMEHARPLFRIAAWNPATPRGLAGWGRHAAARLARRIVARQKSHRRGEQA